MGSRRTEYRVTHSKDGATRWKVWSSTTFEAAQRVLLVAIGDPYQTGAWRIERGEVVISAERWRPIGSGVTS